MLGQGRSHPHRVAIMQREGYVSCGGARSHSPTLDPHDQRIQWQEEESL